MWDQEYDREEYVYGKLPNDFLADHFKAIPKGKVLMLAEGEGRNAVFLAKQGYSVTAVDISPVGLRKAERLAKESGVTIETICADLSDFDLGEGQWDGIVSIFCHLPPPLRQALHSRVEAALKPTGVYFLEAYRPEQLSYKTGGPPVAEMMLTEQGLVEELPNLSFSHMKSLVREVNEGLNHHGLGAVIQAIGGLKPLK
jgi:2-polyprenyl-3-methyl-5-hydroxy-6-metoxy-1,4-benzoquinol methylase